jgi:hypothetical protein
MNSMPLFMETIEKERWNRSERSLDYYSLIYSKINKVSASAIAHNGVVTSKYSLIKEQVKDVEVFSGSRIIRRGWRGKQTLAHFPDLHIYLVLRCDVALSA